MALSLVVLVGAALFVKSLRTVQAVDPGMEPAKVITASVSLGLNGYDFTVPVPAVADRIFRLAAGMLTEEQLATWFRTNLHQL